MQYSKSTKMSEIPDDLDPEEASVLFAAPFDDTARSLVHTLHHLGMTDEQYGTLVDNAAHIVSAGNELLTRMNRDDYDPSVEEYEPVTMMNDLVLIGLLSYTMFANKDTTMEQMEKELMNEMLHKMVYGNDAPPKEES